MRNLLNSLNLLIEPLLNCFKKRSSSLQKRRMFGMSNIFMAKRYKPRPKAHPIRSPAPAIIKISEWKTKSIKYFIYTRSIKIDLIIALKSANQLYKLIEKNQKNEILIKNIIMSYVRLLEYWYLPVYRYYIKTLFAQISQITLHLKVADFYLKRYYCV